MRRCVFCCLGLCVQLGISVLALLTITSLTFSTYVPARAATHAPLLTPLDPQWGWLEELVRRGEVRLGTAAGTLAHDPDLRLRLEANPDGAGSAAARSLRDWLDAERVPDGLGAGLQPRLRLLGQHTDPERQLRPLFLDVRDGEAVDPAWRFRTGLVGRATFHERVTAGVHFTFDSRGDNDPLNRTRSFVQLDASNNFDAAWVRAELGAGAITLGRVPMGWGPERLGGLLLSPTAPAPDMIHALLRWGPHRLQTFAGQLSSQTIEEINERRWLYGHRADLFFLGGRLRLALSETALVAGPNASLDLAYLNPIPLWAQIQVETDGNDATQVNVIDMVDGDYVQTLGSWTSRWYGSLAVDDLQIHPDGRDRSPDQLAWSSGLDLSRAAWLLGYEYRRIGTWTYLHRGDGTEHSTYRRPLGAPEGPDTDRHHLQAEWRTGPHTRWWVEGERRRSGENRITTELTRDGNVGLPFPRGTVEKSWIGAVGVEWALRVSERTTAKAAVRAALHSIENLGHQPGRDEDVWELRLVLDLGAPMLWWKVGE